MYSIADESVLNFRVDYDKFSAEGLVANFTASSLMLFTAVTVYLLFHPNGKAANQ